MHAYTNVSVMTSHLLNAVLGLEARFRLVAAGTVPFRPSVQSWVTNDCELLEVFRHGSQALVNTLPSQFLHNFGSFRLN
jgi:hypothetical protein